MTEFDTIEDALLDAAKTALTINGKQIVRVELLPGDIRDPDVLRQVAMLAPAVYLAPLGGQVDTGIDDLVIPFVWSWLFITNHGAGPTQQLRGDARAPGIYTLMRAVLPAVQGLNVNDIATVHVKRIENLFSGRTEKKGISMWAAPCVAKMYIEDSVDLSTLSDFLIYHAEHSMAPGDDEPPAIDEVNIPQ